MPTAEGHVHHHNLGRTEDGRVTALFHSRGVQLGCHGLAWLLMLLNSGCMTPASFRAIDDPRPGEPLAGRVCVVYSKDYQISLAGFERLHPFDINKYARIYLNLVMDGLIEPADVFVPEMVEDRDLQLVHSDDYLGSLRDSGALATYLELGPVAVAPAWFTDRAILRPFRYATGGTILAGRLALEHGMAINFGGGYHHAGPEGGGFCIYADMPIAIRRLQADGLIGRALVIDLDVHQGNGTALAFIDDDDVYTFDMYEGKIYPSPKQPNDQNIPLPGGTGDDVYLSTLAENLPAVFDVSAPDIVFLQAGVDVLEGDPLASFSVSAEGIVQRDEMVFAEAHRRGIPIVMVLGGGYSDRAWEVQYASIRSLIERYGVRGPKRPSRRPSVKERLYTR